MAAEVNFNLTVMPAGTTQASRYCLPGCPPGLESVPDLRRTGLPPMLKGWKRGIQIASFFCSYAGTSHNAGLPSTPPIICPGLSRHHQPRGQPPQKTSVVPASIRSGGLSQRSLKLYGRGPWPIFLLCVVTANGPRRGLLIRPKL